MFDILLYVIAFIAGLYIGLTMFQHKLRKIRREGPKCQFCKGIGSINNRMCIYCNGTGTRKSER